MHHLTVLLSLTLTLTLTLNRVYSQPSSSDQYQAGDGRTYYNLSNPCTLSNFFPVGRAYNEKTATYTLRDEVKCCTYTKTRDSCCLDSETKQCKCATSAVCDLQTTTVPTTTAAPTITPFKSLCAKPQARLLNGQPVTNDCPFAGIAKIISRVRNNVVCNAVFTTATVNGTLKSTFLTDVYCKRLIDSSFSKNLTEFNIVIGNKNLPLVKPIFTLIDGPKGTAFLDVASEYLGLLDCLGPCQKTSCPYNKEKMGGLVDLNICKVLSWGTINSRLQQKGLYEVAVALNQAGCTDVPLSDVTNTNSTMCFRAVSGLNLYCAADNGAPVYCKAPSNQEWILIGVTARIRTCEYGPEIKVLPYPG